MIFSRLAARRFIESALKEADVLINGSRPWDILVHDERFFRQVAIYGSLGAGESYMEGWWDCERIDEMTYRVLRQGLVSRIGSQMLKFLAGARVWLFDLQKGRRARQIADVHYDLSV